MSLKMLSLLSSYPIQCPLTCERIWSLNWSIFRIQHVLVKCWPRIPVILTLPLPWVWSETEVNFRTNVCTPDQGSDDVDSALISTWEENNENDPQKSSSYEVLYTRVGRGYRWKKRQRGVTGQCQCEVKPGVWPSVCLSWAISHWGGQGLFTKFDQFRHHLRGCCPGHTGGGL